jgi:hypothetical protein
MLGSLGQINRLVQLRNLTGNAQISNIQIAPLAQAEVKEETAES